MLSMLLIVGLRQEIFHKISIRDRLTILSIYRSLHYLMRDEEFWKEQTRLDFPLRVQGEDLSSVIYRSLYSKVTIPVYSSRYLRGTAEIRIGNLPILLSSLRIKYPSEKPVVANSNFDPIDVFNCRLRDFDILDLHIMMIPTGHLVNRGSIYYQLNPTYQKVIFEGDGNGDMYELSQLRQINNVLAWSNCGLIYIMYHLGVECPSMEQYGYQQMKDWFRDNPIYFVGITDAEEEEIRFYYNWLRSGCTKEDMIESIRRTAAETNKAYCIKHGSAKDLKEEVEEYTRKYITPTVWRDPIGGY